MSRIKIVILTLLAVCSTAACQDSSSTAYMGYTAIPKPVVIPRATPAPAEGSNSLISVIKPCPKSDIVVFCISGHLYGHFQSALRELEAGSYKTTCKFVVKAGCYVAPEEE